MDKTLFELVPVSVKPEEDGWYFVIEPNHETGKNYCEWDSLNNGWYDEAANRREPTYYLRPLPPPVAEERAQDELWDEVENTLRHFLARDCHGILMEIKQQFNITKK